MFRCAGPSQVDLHILNLLLGNLGNSSANKRKPLVHGAPARATEMHGLTQSWGKTIAEGMMISDQEHGYDIVYFCHI